MPADTVFVAWLLVYINVFDAFMIEWLAGAVQCKNFYVGNVDHLIASLFRTFRTGLIGWGCARRRSPAGVVIYKICL